jgi:hypothetical protein
MYHFQASIQYQSIFREPMLKALQNDHSEVRQMAAYGFGVMAYRGGPNYAPVCSQALEPLAIAIGRSDALQTKENIIARENAVSAVAKFLKFNSHSLDANAVGSLFIFIFIYSSYIIYFLIFSIVHCYL